MTKVSMQNRVFVIDTNKQPLMPCHPARARKLLQAGKAAVYRRFPFTIILTYAVEAANQPVQMKIDPGSRTTGIALVTQQRVIWAANLEHKGHHIVQRLLSRRQLRRSRRTRNLRYRPARFMNRRRKPGWLPPSVNSRIQNIKTWMLRIYWFVPVDSISLEDVKFDTQALENPEIEGVEYQQGTLFGYEVREYLLEKWNRTCVYCGVQNVPLEIEHIVPKSRGGSNRISNLTVSCSECNRDKGNQTAEEYGFPNIQKQAKCPLKDAAAVNSMRNALAELCVLSGLPVEFGTGGQTKYNRRQQHYAKDHWIDAACIGNSGEDVQVDDSMQSLTIKAMGRGSHRICQTDKYGFPKLHKTRKKIHFGFQTGDIIKATIPSGKYAGTHEGRVTVRSKPSFVINTKTPTHAKYCKLVHRNDGYNYEYS